MLNIIYFSEYKGLIFKGEILTKGILEYGAVLFAANNYYIEMDKQQILNNY